MYTILLSYFSSSNGKFDYTLSFLDSYIVSVKEVAIESSLEGTREDLSPAVEAVNLPSEDPIENIEESIKS